MLKSGRNTIFSDSQMVIACKDPMISAENCYKIQCNLPEETINDVPVGTINDVPEETINEVPSNNLFCSLTGLITRHS